MSLLNVERIKLTSTRSPWWCAAVAIVLSVGLGAILAATYSAEVAGVPAGVIPPLSSSYVQAGSSIGLFVVMVMAALTVTSEYRFGVIRTTFQAEPRRSRVLLAKAALVALVVLVLGELIAFATFGMGSLLAGESGISLSTAQDVRVTAGVGLAYAAVAVLAVAVGALIRQSAGAVVVLLLFPLLIENLVGIIPTVGDDIYQWLPFVNLNNFLGQGTGPITLSPWGSLAYFVAIVAAVMAVALVVVNRRDA